MWSLILTRSLARREGLGMQLVKVAAANKADKIETNIMGKISSVEEIEGRLGFASSRAPDQNSVAALLLSL
jgi:hypothetical protein